jgi:hypothetical protein
LVRCGAHESDPGGPTGAIRVLAADRSMSHAEFVFRNNTVRAPLESAVSIQGPSRVSGLSFDGLVTEGAAFIADVRPGTQGAAVFSHVTTAGSPPAYRNASPRLFDLSH